MTRPVVLAVAALAAAAVPASASAASGTSVLTLKGSAATSLSKAGVKVSAVAPAKAKGKVITFPVSSVTVGSAASLDHSGAIRFKKASRTLTLKAPALRLAGSGSRLTSKVGSKTTTILTVDAKQRSLDGTAGTVALKGGAVRLTAAGAAAIKRALKVKALKSGTFGTLTVDAARGSTGASGGSGSTGSGTTGGTGAGGAGSGSGGGSTGTGGSGGPQGDGDTTSCATGPIAAPSGGPGALTTPPTSTPVIAGSITWHVRDSFIRYINTGEGTAMANGATADPATGSPALTYQFHFPFTGGWYDAASDTTRLTFSGTVLFCYFDHGIKLTASNPEVEVNGGGSRAIFVTGNVDQPNKRGVLVNLTPVPRADAGPTTHTWSQMPGKIPADAGSSTFAGYYGAGEEFGWITVSATT